MTALPWANFAKHNHSVLECVQTTDSFARAIFFWKMKQFQKFYSTLAHTFSMRQDFPKKFTIRLLLLPIG